jgi:hypothetical protein
MKSITQIRYIWNFLKVALMIGTVLALLMSGSATFAKYNKITKVQAYVETIISSTSQDIIYVDDTTIFTIENPPVDFEVVDADPFDGYGDNGPYSTFNDVLLGTLGECRSMAEFDISQLDIPSAELIKMATFEVIITEIDIYGLGVNGETPESLAVDGYVGNGLEELSDFEAGDDNVLDSIDTPNPQIGQVINFNVTSFVVDLVNAQEQYVGLTVRAETFGGLWVTEGDVYPKLTIEIENQPPNNPSTPSGSTFLNIDELGTYSTNATDPDGDQLQYRFDWDANESHDYSDWTDFVPSNTTVSMNNSWNSGGSYVVKAQARDIYNETSGWSNGLSVHVNSPPNAPIIFEENETLYVYAIDPDGDDMYYLIDWGDGETSDWFGPYSSGQKAELIHEWEDGVYDIRAKAKDIYNAESPWSDPYTVVIGNHPPDIIVIDGPKCGDPGVEYTYTFIAEDFEGYEIYYFVDWGDGTYFDWFGPFPSGTEISLTHSWGSEGSYNIRVKAKDIFGAEGEWSDPYPIVIGNQPPDEPVIGGSHSGKVEMVYDFSFVADDPDGDNVTYEIKWGDNNSVEKGPYASGVKIIVNHSWEELGTYIIEARVKDEFCGFYSEWTEFEVTIKRTRAVYHPFLLRLLECYPLLGRLLNLFS